MEPPVHKARAPRRWAAILACALLAVGPWLPFGCESSYSMVGKSPIWAEYSFGSLAADLPRSTRVPAVVGAADAALRHRGYSITSAAATEEEGAVHAVPPASGGGRGVGVWARAIGEGTRVKVKVGLVGNEALSRAVLEDILRRLGL